ncbi:MAG: copper resistance protein CopC [Pseudomonadota bacterium]
MRFFAITLLALLAPLQALAHAQLRVSDPAEGAVVAEQPAVVTLTFNEAVAPLVLRLTGPDGEAVDLEGVAENEAVAVPLPATGATGTILLSWRVVSSDGHPVGGTLTFHVGAPSEAPPSAERPTKGAARLAAVLRLTLTAALVLAVGGALFIAVVDRSEAGAELTCIIPAAAVATPVAGALLIGAEGLDMLGLPPADLAKSPPWRAGLRAPITTTVVLSAVGAALAAGSLRAAGKHAQAALAISAWILASLSFAASGHAAVAPPRLVATSAVALHAAALIFWMGSLIPLVLALGRADADALLRRFSSIAAPMVGVLAISGATLVWLQSGGLAALAASTYGALLAVKLALAAGLLILAARNRLVLTPALAQGRPEARPRLAHAIRAEIVIGIAILALASAFRLTPPPRALAEPAEPLFLHIHRGDAMADLSLTPGRAGPVEVSLGFQTADFEELTPQEVEIAFAKPEAGIEPLRLDALRGGDGFWHAGPVVLPRPGDWQVTVRLLITDFERVTLTDTLNLPE